MEVRKKRKYINLIVFDMILFNYIERIENITYNIEKNIIYYNNNTNNLLYTDRKTANIMVKILKDCDIDINNRDIPQF